MDYDYLVTGIEPCHEFLGILDLSEMEIKMLYVRQMDGKTAAWSPAWFPYTSAQKFSLERQNADEAEQVNLATVSVD
jgi:hypothetical protein